MEHKVNKRNIRDRLLSLFIILGMLMGLFTGLATPKQAEAADNLKRTIKLGGDDVGATNTLRQFDVPESLAETYELASDGVFDVHGTDADKVKKYSEAKGMSTKKTGAYAPLAKKYTIKEAIAADNTYCIWIPFQKRHPKGRYGQKMIC